MTEFSPNFFVDAPPKMTRREQHRILGVKAVIAGLQDVVLPELDPTTDLGAQRLGQLTLFDFDLLPELPEAL